MQKIPWALLFDLDKAGKSMPARIAMIAITTKSSMSVNPRECGDRRLENNAWLFHLEEEGNDVKGWNEK